VRIKFVASICGVTAVLVLIPACSSLQTNEPRYEGKRLGVWMAEVNTFTNNGEPATQYEVASTTWTNIVCAVGTNGLPFYLHHIGDTTDEMKQYRAEQAIETLGPAAESAIPMLASYLKDNRTAMVAAKCLLAIGPASIPCLVKSVETLTNQGQTCAMTMLGEFGPVAKPAIPALIQIIQGDSMLAWPALQSLVEIETNAQVMLPLLALHLSDTNCGPGTAYALGRLGNAGVPLLLLSLTNEPRILRCSAVAALDPRFQKYATDKVETNHFWFQRLHCEFNTFMLGAAAHSYSQGDYVAVAKVAERYTNSSDINIRDAANTALIFLQPLAATNVSLMKIQSQQDFTPKPPAATPSR
jgi:hypothetical protein